MTDGCCTVGALAKLSIGGQRLQFIEFDPIRVMKTQSDGSKQAIRGRLDHDSNLVAEGILYVDYRIALYQTAENLDVLLPIMGGVESPTDTFTIADALASTTVILGINGCPEVTFGNSFCGKWVARGQKGGDPPRIDLWFRACSRTENPVNTHFTSQTSPSLLVEYPYAFAGGTIMDYGGNPYNFNQYAIGMDYGLVAEWNNNVDATNICPTDHAINVAAGMFYAPCANTVVDLVTTPFSGDVTGGAFSLAFSRTVGMNTYSTTFNVGNVKPLGLQPAVRNKSDFVRLSFNAQGYAVGTSPAMIINNVA